MPAVQTPTLRDVADAAGVHPATASRALNPATRGLVNADTARRVIKVAEGLGYRPNPIARGLKTSKSGTIGLVIPDLTNPLFPPIVRGIEDVLEPAGYSGLIVNTDNDPQREHAQIELLRSRQVEGLIVATALIDHPLLARLQREGVPMVMVNRRPDGVDVPSITPDDATGIELAVAHLAELGHTRIGHLAGPATTSTGVARQRAFRNAVRDRELDGDPRWSSPASTGPRRPAPTRCATCSTSSRRHGRGRRQRPDRARLLRRVRRARHRVPAGDERRRLQRHAVPRQARPAAHHHRDPPPADRGRSGPDAARRHRRARAGGPLGDAAAGLVVRGSATTPLVRR